MAYPTRIDGHGREMGGASSCVMCPVMAQFQVVTSIHPFLQPVDLGNCKSLYEQGRMISEYSALNYSTLPMFGSANEGSHNLVRHGVLVKRYNFCQYEVQDS